MAKTTKKTAKKSAPVKKNTPKAAAPVSKQTTPPTKTRPVKELETKDSGLTFDPEGAASSAEATAQFSYLEEPDTKFAAGTTGKHKITGVFTHSAEYAAMCARILAFENRYRAHAKLPLVKEPSILKSDSEKFDGAPYIEFSSNAKEDENGNIIPVPVFGPDGHPTKLKAFSGDTVRVEYVLAGYNTATAKGIKAYLNAVQVIKKNSSGGQRGGTFKKADGGARTGGSFAKGKAQVVTDEGADLAEEDVPF